MNIPDHARVGGTHSEAELREMIVKMRATSGTFYGGAVRTGNHAFIEFTGLMNEYIQLCERALAQGIDFTLLNTHSGLSLPMPEHCKRYLSEKLECIFTGHDELAKKFERIAEERDQRFRERAANLGRILEKAGAIRLTTGQDYADETLAWLERMWGDNGGE